MFQTLYFLYVLILDILIETVLGTWVAPVAHKLLLRYAVFCGASLVIIYEVMSFYGGVYFWKFARALQLWRG